MIEARSRARARYSVPKEKRERRKQRPDRRPRMSDEEFLKYVSIFRALYNKLCEQGDDPDVGKAQIQFVVGNRGHAPSHVDRKWRKSSDPRYTHYYDPDFPKPEDPTEYRLRWKYSKLLAYRLKKYGC